MLIGSRGNLQVTVEADDRYAVMVDNIKAGTISVRREDDRTEVEMWIEPEMRGKHYAAEALYIITPYIHAHYNVNAIHAVVSRDNQIWKHVVEHNGYYIAAKDDENIYYTHRENMVKEDDGTVPEGQKCLYLAGGCFWGMERVFKQLNGVTATSTGYANGFLPHPTYADVCRNETGYRETVRVVFDPSVISAETILEAYFLCIDPTVQNRQGNDTGSQYQTGVYWRDPSLEETVRDYFAREKEKYPVFCVECQPLECFYEAEAYHQDYLTKNPQGYCHITSVDLEKVRRLNDRVYNEQKKGGHSA